VNRVPIASFLEKASEVPLLDVRSPAEYAAGHIPNAVSFPLFSNHERSEVGTIYKQQGSQVAIIRGLEIIGPKMADFIREAQKLNADSFALYCWRGGMRSESMAWLLSQYGLHTHVLEGGYKAFRNHIIEFFNQPMLLRVITGNTGSKKTLLLNELKRKGEQVIDLEGLANHQGSSFGKYKEGYKPETEHFQNLLFEACRDFDLGRHIWVEDEGIRIGQVIVIDGLYRQMQKSPRYVIDIERDERLDYLVDEYGKLSNDQLIEATHAIRKKLGFDHADEAIRLIEANELREAASIILVYYDKKYQLSISEREAQIHGRFTGSLNDLSTLADQLIQSKSTTYAV
jgi:tRNA 2-selenouridine synthase